MSNASAVSAAVLEWAAKAPAPADIREATLVMMRPHREKLLALLRDAGVSDDVCARYARRIPHKLGLRCGQSPWRNMTMGLPWPAGTAAAR